MGMPAQKMEGQRCPISSCTGGSTQRQGCLSRFHCWGTCLHFNCDSQSCSEPRTGSPAVGSSFLCEGAWNSLSNVRRVASPDLAGGS